MGEIMMKICGCDSCRKNGEVNPYELFEVYLLQREDSEQKKLKGILGAGFSARELDELEAKFSDSTVVVNRINEYGYKPFNAQNYWESYGGSLGAFERIQRGEDI